MKSRDNSPPFVLELRGYESINSHQKEDKKMHTQCIKKYEVNNVEIAFTNKKMTAYGGFSLLASFFEKIKFREIIDNSIPLHETSPNRMKLYDKVLGYSLIFYAGGSRFSHVLYLGCKETLSKLFGIERLPKSSSTLTRLFNKLFSMKEVEEMSFALWNYLKALIPWSEIKEDWLGFDSTVLTRYGKQEGAKRGYNPIKKGRNSHNPLISFLNRSKYIVHLWNRSGNVSSGNNIVGFFDTTWIRLERLIHIKGIIADSGFYLLKFIEHLESKNLVYIITARLSQRLQKQIYSLQSWEVISDGIWANQFFYEPNKWKKARRYIAIRQDITKRNNAMGKQLKLFQMDTNNYRYSVWITNSKEKAHDVWNLSKPRANDENTIKELKEDFALAGFSLKSFYSTEAAMLIRILAYNLFVLFRYKILGQKEKTKRLKTIRFKYFVVPATLGSSGRATVLRISAHSLTLKNQLKYLLNTINQYNPLITVNCNAVGT